MAENENGPPVTIALEPKNLSARVILPEGLDPETLSVQLLSSMARERGIELNAEAEATLARVVEAYKNSGEPISEIFAKAVPPMHGTPGYIEWMPGFDPENPDANHDKAGDEKVDFYAHQSFVKVKKEDHVATIHPPTDGEDGRDVTGRTIAASPGKPAAFVVDSTLLHLSDGRILAQIDGLLRFDGKKIMIDPVLDLQGGVDFSTGNIDFDGDVIIHRDIRDRFRVKATGNVTIEGLIDASHIDCGGVLHARRGVAGRGEGTLDVGGDAHIAYLDQVKGHVGGDLYLTREMMHSTLSVGGNLISDLGVIIGGCASIVGNARVADLGSASETPTEVRLGAGAAADGPAGDAAAQIAELTRQVDAMRAEMESLKLTAGPRNPTAAERLTELTFEIGDLETQLASLATAHPALAGRVTKCDSVLEVLREIHGRVTLRIGSHTVAFIDEVKGPLKVWLEEAGEVVCQFGDGNPQPIRTLQGVTDRAAA